MLPIFIPAIFAVLEKTVGFIADKTVLAGKLAGVALNSSFGQNILDIVELYLGKLSESQRMEMQMELNSLLGQIQINTLEAQSPSLWYRARGFLTWGLAINVVLNATVFEIANILRVCGYNILELQSMDPVTIGFLSSLLGVLVIGKTVEKLTGIAPDHRD